MPKLFVAALLALGIMIPLRAASTDTAMLKRISSRVDDHAGVISIEASDPVPYVASQPDPMTFVIEMRDVLAVGFADNFTRDPRVPITGVHVENARAFDGASIARVSVALAQPPASSAALVRPPPFAISGSSVVARRRRSR
ncbi:MAG: hypothetical protein DMF88_10120 [Acidobacteria bacterium]|nr:MAG: hypothetical protein DMF88_10120 [Acidobacteriota bacterium]